MATSDIDALSPCSRDSLRLSYMLLDCAQILKGSGFFWRVPLVGGSNGGKLGRGWVGGGGTGGGAASVSVGTGGTAGTARAGESVWVLRWLHTLCWELPWLSFLSNCWQTKREVGERWKVGGGGQRERQVREKRGFAIAEVSSCLCFSDATACKSSSDPGVEGEGGERNRERESCFASTHHWTHFPFQQSSLELPQNIRPWVRNSLWLGREWKLRAEATQRELQRTTDGPRQIRRYWRYWVEFGDRQSHETNEGEEKKEDRTRGMRCKAILFIWISVCAKMCVRTLLWNPHTSFSSLQKYSPDSPSLLTSI